MKTTHAIIVAGGSGTRFGSAVPKQFLLLAGKPVLMHTIERFAGMPGVRVVVVLPAAQRQLWRQLCSEHSFAAEHTVVDGGDSRWASVKNALDSIEPQPGDLVAVHDGVRPLVSRQLVERCLQAAARQGSAIPATAVTDSVRQLDAAGGSHALDRATLRAVQTPQVFDAALLKQAYGMPFSPLYTDDASVWETAGHQVTLVEGDPANMKITRPADLAVAQLLMAQ